MQTKNRLWAIVSGVLVIITMLFNISLMSLYAKYDLLDSFGGILLIASFLTNIPFVVFLFSDHKKRAIIPYAIKVFITFLYVIGGFSLYNVFSFITEGIMLFILLTSIVSTEKNILKRIWFIPAILRFFMTILALAGGSSFTLANLLQALVNVLSYVTIALWASDIYTSDASVNNIDTPQKNTSCADGYCDLITHILLLLFTFGIWQYIWIYKTTSYLNNTPDEEYRNPTTKLLLCMFVPFYYIYWIYKSAQRIDKLAVSRSQQSDISLLCLILSIFISVVAPIIMQDKINNIVTPKTNENPTTSDHSSVIGIADEIKKYKDLLDAGIITEEEFDIKKKQLLAL